MDGYCGNTLVMISPTQFFGKEEIRQFTLSISHYWRRGETIHWRLQAVEINRRGSEMCETRQTNNPDICIRLFCRLEEGRKEDFGEKSMSHMIRAKLDFIAFLRCTGGYAHDSRIQEQD